MKRHQIINSVFIFVIGVLVVISTIQYRNNNHLKERIRERDNYLESLVVNDSLMISSSDSIREIIRETKFIVGNKEMGADEFILYVNALRSQIYSLEDSLQYYKLYYEASKKVYENKFKIEGNSYTFSYKARDTLSSREIEQLFYDRQKLQNVLKRYEIKIKEIDASSFIISAPKIDSALLLLPYYRNKLEFIPDKNVWVITYEQHQ